jgi:integrase
MAALDQLDKFRLYLARNELANAPVLLVLRAATAPKYKAAFATAYGAGLRVSEVVTLKVGDIDSERMLLRVERGKGRKDRHAMLSPQLLELLRAWWREGRRRSLLRGGSDAPNRRFSRWKQAGS